MKPDFMDRIEKIIAEVRTRTCITGIDTDVLFEILHAELSEYHNKVFAYGKTTGYDEGYDDGYCEGSGEAADRAYYEGRYEGYDAGYDEGINDGYYEGYDDGYERRVCRLSRVFHGSQYDRDADFNRSK